MKIFVDEDAGASIGRALAAVGVQAEYVAGGRAIRPATRDEIWIPWAGREGSLVLSRNTGILEAEAQRALLMAARVGVVFLPPYLSPLALLRLLMKRWDWLETLDATQKRPFAYRMSASGRTTRLKLSTTSAEAMHAARAAVSRFAHP